MKIGVYICPVCATRVSVMTSNVNARVVVRCDCEGRDVKMYQIGVK